MNEVSTNFRRSILALEHEMMKYPQVEGDVSHYYGDKVYVRTLNLPAGVVLTGRIHKFDHVFVLLSGHIHVISEGSSVDALAGYIVESKAGTKRAIYVHEDSTLLTAHGTQETDPDKMLDELFLTTYESFDQFLLENKS